MGGSNTSANLSYGLLNELQMTVVIALLEGHSALLSGRPSAYKHPVLANVC